MELISLLRVFQLLLYTLPQIAQVIRQVFIHLSFHQSIIPEHLGLTLAHAKDAYRLQKLCTLGERRQKNTCCSVGVFVISMYSVVYIQIPRCYAEGL